MNQRELQHEMVEISLCDAARQRSAGRVCGEMRRPVEIRSQTATRVETAVRLVVDRNGVPGDLDLLGARQVHLAAAPPSPPPGPDGGVAAGLYHYHIHN